MVYIYHKTALRPTLGQHSAQGVRDYTIGGYQVIKKWLSYREERILGRSLQPEEAYEVMHMARRILAIVLLEPALNASYRAVKREPYEE
jgi:hypothetical protein